jgi:predicted transcriptional regulator
MGPVASLLGPVGGDTLVIPMNSPTTLKVPRALKARINRLAKKAGRSPHAFMLEALERQTRREELLEEFTEEALAADRAIDEGGEVYAAEDVHRWLEQLARGERPARPKPWRG